MINFGGNLLHKNSWSIIISRRLHLNSKVLLRQKKHYFFDQFPWIFFLLDPVLSKRSQAGIWKSKQGLLRQDSRLQMREKLKLSYKVTYRGGYTQCSIILIVFYLAGTQIAKGWELLLLSINVLLNKLHHNFHFEACKYRFACRFQNVMECLNQAQSDKKWQKVTKVSIFKPTNTLTCYWVYWGISSCPLNPDLPIGVKSSFHRKKKF